ncbi:MAG: hypothetical protein PVS2B2_27120 [Candidatus Acidiferrum sp.]
MNLGKVRVLNSNTLERRHLRDFAGLLIGKWMENTKERTLYILNTD